ncbi:hypothetical protein GY03_15925 [Proteus vulgaris]|uniref:hypothetical protein n=1 Tax=Proteus vulgaris TaxID=585 RepID=UPI0021B14095|nr:hypothetical protein [Proteus vulgaris]MCT6518764.1 hypothetical protein [Proteus vulgaris]
MEVCFDKLVSFLPANDKRENVAFLLSEKIANCSNSLSNDSFFILKHKMSSIYVDKHFLTEIKSELTNVINEYIKDNPHHLDKINKANNKLGGFFLDKKNCNYLTVVDLNSLDIVQKFIDAIISETGSSSLKNKILNKDNNPAINLFFEKGFLCRFERKSISKLIKEIKNKIIELNPGCSLPFRVDDKKYILVKLGNVEAANNIETHTNKVDNLLNEENNKLELTKFELLFNFLNEYIRELYNEINSHNKYNKYNEYVRLNNIFDFTKDGEGIHTTSDNKSIQDYAACYHKFNEKFKLLDLFYKGYVKKMKDGELNQNDYANLSGKIKEIESDTESLKTELESLRSFSNACDQYENEIKDAASYLIMKGKNNVFSSITSMEEKINEYKKILSDCIKRKETSILSRVYKWIFPKKHANAIGLLNKHLDKIKKISSYLSGDDIKKNDIFLKNEIIEIVTATLSEMEIPRTLLSYLYGENRKWDNVKRSLFN